MKTIDVTNLNKFNSDLKKMLKSEKEDARIILIKLSMDGLRTLQTITPKKTRRAAAGWNPNVDSPPSEWKPPVGQAGYALSLLTQVNKIRYNSVVNLSNNVEYIVPLDKGHSKQAQAIVAPTIARLEAILAMLKRVYDRRRRR